MNEAFCEQHVFCRGDGGETDVHVAMERLRLAEQEQRLAEGALVYAQAQAAWSICFYLNVREGDFVDLDANGAERVQFVRIDYGDSLPIVIRDCSARGKPHKATRNLRWEMASQFKNPGPTWKIVEAEAG